jgi:hypothetical protein
MVRGVWLAGLCRDVLRALWALVYWNLRKTFYVLKGRRGTPPCQNDHDVADRVQPRCRAVWDWEGPGRFHRVCPSLVRTAEGWRCGAVREQVRPHWWRAAVVYGLLAAGAYAGVTSALWGVWRKAGYREINYTDVAWPGRWGRVKQDRAEHFRRQARRALQAGDFSAALLSMTTAEGFGRAGFEDGMMLARLWAQAGNPAFAMRVYHEITTAYPSRAAEAAVLWHDQLLAGAHLELLARLCVEQLAVRGAGARESVWEFSLAFAMDHGRLAREVTGGGLAAALPARVRTLADVLVRWQDGDPDEAGRMLAEQRFTAEEPMAVRRQVEWLARLGRVEEAGVILIRQAAVLGDFEVAALRYQLGVVTGDRDAARADFRGLLRARLSALQADRLCALLIETSDGESLKRTPGFFAEEGVKEDARAQAAFWVAAVVNELPVLAERARERYALASGGDLLPKTGSIDFGRFTPSDKRSPLFVVSAVPLPRETIYAVIGRMFASKQATHQSSLPE